MAASDVKRNWSPDLRAELGRRQSGDSRWIRQGGDPTWVAPNPILMNNKCSGSKSGNNSTGNEERIQNNHEEREAKELRLLTYSVILGYYSLSLLQKSMSMRKQWKRTWMMN
jgi:hypothetical protein